MNCVSKGFMFLGNGFLKKGAGAELRSVSTVIEIEFEQRESLLTLPGMEMRVSIPGFLLLRLHPAR